MSRLGIIVALRHEKKVLGNLVHHPNCHVVVSGIGREKAAGAARQAVRDGCGALVSFGVSGGLDPQLTSGMVIVPSQVTVGKAGNAIEVNSAWRDRLLQISPLMTAVETTLTSTELVTAVEMKSELWQSTHASAVDMEAYDVVAAARDANIPALAIRAVADPASTRLPPILSRESTESEIGPFQLAAALISAPMDFSDVVRLVINGRRALRQLGRVARLAGPSFVL